MIKTYKKLPPQGTVANEYRSYNIPYGGDDANNPFRDVPGWSWDILWKPNQVVTLDGHVGFQIEPDPVDGNPQTNTNHFMGGVQLAANGVHLEGAGPINQNWDYFQKYLTLPFKWHTDEQVIKPNANGIVTITVQVRVIKLNAKPHTKVWVKAPQYNALFIRLEDN